MIAVVVLADSPHCRLWSALEALPEDRFRLWEAGDGPFPPGKTIAVLGDLLSRPPQRGLLPNCPAVFSGQNPWAADFVREEGLLPLDCGLSLRDSLTLSSLTPGSAVLSLQRPVVSLDGGVSEAGELPLSLSREWAPFPLLCTAGVLLLAHGAAAIQTMKF